MAINVVVEGWWEETKLLGTSQLFQPPKISLTVALRFMSLRKIDLDRLDATLHLIGVSPQESTDTGCMRGQRSTKLG